MCHNFNKGKFLFVLFFSLIFEWQYAQEWEEIDTLNYQYRNQLTGFYTKKSETIIAELEKTTDKNIRKELLQIYNESKQNFLKTIQKGYFIDKKPYQIVLDSLFYKITKANPETEHIKVLVEINEEPNAYNTGEDFVSLYLPLLSKVEHTEQLAFIICHEMAHQLLQHPLSNLKKNVASFHSEQVKEKIQNIKKQKYNRNQKTEMLLKDLVYTHRKSSRVNEIQADSLGFILFSKAFPNQKQYALSVLHLLDSIDVEQDSLVENDYYQLFHSEKQAFKRSWLVNDEFDMYSYNTAPKFWELDSLKTHPDCHERILALKNNFSLNETTTVDENNTFRPLKKQAQNDVVFGLYFLKEYGKSLYETLLLLKNNQNDVFLRKMTYQNLLRIQEAQKNYTVNRYVENVNPRYSISYNTFLTFIRKLRKTELENLIQMYQN